MLPMSRKNLRRLPFADRSMRSAALAPLNSIVSVPIRPSTVSLPSPGSQTNVSSPAPRSARSSPLFPSIESFPKPPSSSSVPEPPARLSSSVPAVERRWDAVGEGAVGLVDPDDIVAGAGVDGDPLDALAPDLELGLAVVAEVDLENAGLAGLEAKGDPVAGAGAVDLQDAVLELRRASGRAAWPDPARPRAPAAPATTAATAANCLMSRAVIHVDASPLE